MFPVFITPTGGLFGDLSFEITCYLDVRMAHHGFRSDNEARRSAYFRDGLEKGSK